jgi:hypothetical protein
MIAKKLPCTTLLLAGLVFADASEGLAAEYAFTTYPLGSLSFGAGITPPPGVYVTDAISFYTGSISGNIDIGGRVFNAGAKADIFSNDVSILMVPEGKLLDGRLGVLVSTPVSNINIEASVSGPRATLTDRTQGTGLGDTILEVELGWDQGEFSHSLHILGVVPTGRYQPGFYPLTGFNRPSLDIGWAFTWFDKASKLEFNGGVGFMTSWENEATRYQTGNEFHVEWAIGYKFDNGLEIGVAGYDYRQVTGDSGPGAVLAPFIGKLDAVGPGLSYANQDRRYAGDDRRSRL